MFNGIIETTGIIAQIEVINGCKNLVVTPKQNFDHLVVGESIAVNGVCLTVTHFTSHAFAITVVPQTLRLTNLDQLAPGDEVNLERALQANSRISGHYVQGHVDGPGQIIELQSDNGDALLAKISVSSELEKYIVAKGYIALDGMSITVIDSKPDYFTVTFIPHTQQMTIIRNYSKGRILNIEVDILGKHVEKLLGVHAHACSQ